MFINPLVIYLLFSLFVSLFLTKNEEETRVTQVAWLPRVLRFYGLKRNQFGLRQGALIKGGSAYEPN